MEIKSYKRLVFFIPGHKVGGTNTLFEALIKKLIDLEKNIDIAVVDYKDGYVARSLANITREISILDWSYKVYIEDHDIFICDFLSAKNLLYNNIEISPKAKLFLWVTHPHDIFKWIPTFNLTLKRSSWLKKINIRVLHNSYSKRLTRFISEANKKQSLKFMDNFCLEEYENLFKVKLAAPSIFPVFTLESCKDQGVQKNIEEIISDNILNVFWLGRVADFKTQTILNIIYDLNKFNQNKIPTKAKFHLIGDGVDLQFIRNKVDKINNLDVKFYGSLRISEVRQLLANNKGIMIGHGISILEGARSKYPCIVADGISCRSRKLLYRRLVNEEPYGVGRVIEDKKQLKGYSLETIISEVFKSAVSGEEEFDRWEKQHSLDEITKKFISIILESSSLLSVEDFNKFNFKDGNFIEKLTMKFKTIIK